MNPNPGDSPSVQPQLDHRETQALFLALLDEELPGEEARRVQAHLEACRDCQAGWTGYRSTVERVRALEREKAPAALASRILLRVQKRRTQGLRALHRTQVEQRLPVEVLVPILLAAAVAAWVMLAAS